MDFGHYKPDELFHIGLERPEERGGRTEPVRQQVIASTTIPGQTQTAEYTDGRQTRTDEGRS